MRRNSLLQDNPSPFSPFEMEEVLSEATESENESSSTQDWPPLYITWSSDSDSDSEEVIPAVTESEAVRLLAARIPPELFDGILFYVNVDRVSQRHEAFRESGTTLYRNRGTPSPDDTLTYLKQCSLVCLFWANRCRSHMFSERGLRIQSYEDAEIFRQYVVGGCPRLTPVHQLIESIHVSQKYSGMWASQGSGTLTSFLHLLYLPTIQDKFQRLFIEGPVPEGFNPAKLDTPHWGIPPCNVVPSSFLRSNIEIRNVHFPSFSHVIKYIRHFLCAAYIVFHTITWDAHGVPLILPHASSTIVCQRRPRSLRIWTKGGCTNAVHLVLTALMLNPNCPLHRLSDEERVWMIGLLTLLWGDKKDPYVWIGFDISEQATTMNLYPFHFVFEEAPATDRPDSVLSVVGIHAYIYHLRELPASFDALVNHARTRPTIHALVLFFDSFDYLQESIKPFVEVLALATGTIELVLAYEEKERKAVGVDLATLEPNDCLWADLRGPYGEDKSLDILQRQLKKKRWMSLH